MGIPRWLTVANFLGIVAAFALAIPFGASASHGQQPPTNLRDCGRPSPPAGTAVTGIKMCWNDPGAGTTTQYRLQRSTSTNFDANVVEFPIAKNTFEFWDETSTPVGTFHYRILSVIGSDRSGWSNKDSVVNNSGFPLPAGAPTAPDELAVEVLPSGVRFSWKDRSGNEAFFRVERGTGEAGQNLTWEWRGNVGPASGTGSRVSFNDSDAGQAPTYRVTAFNARCPAHDDECAASRSYAFGPTPNTGVNVGGVNSIVNGVVSAVPTNVQSLIPSNATGLVSPYMSAATALASGIASAVPTNVQSVASPYVSAATAIASGVTSAIAPSGIQSTVDAFASAATVIASNFAGIASPYTSLASSVLANPTGILDPVNKAKIFIGVRTGTPPNQQLFGVWVLPTSCIGFNCLPPAANDPLLSCTGAFGLELCFLVTLS